MNIKFYLLSQELALFLLVFEVPSGVFLLVFRFARSGKALSALFWFSEGVVSSFLSSFSVNFRNFGEFLFDFLTNSRDLPDDVFLFR